MVEDLLFAPDACVRDWLHMPAVERACGGTRRHAMARADDLVAADARALGRKFMKAEGAKQP